MCVVSLLSTDVPRAQEVSVELQGYRREEQSRRASRPTTRRSQSSSTRRLHPIFEEEFARENMVAQRLLRDEMPQRLGASSLPGIHSLRWDPPTFGTAEAAPPRPGTSAPTVPRMSDDKFDSRRGPQQLSRALTLASLYQVTDAAGDSVRQRKRVAVGDDEAAQSTQSASQYRSEHCLCPCMLRACAPHSRPRCGVLACAVIVSLTMPPCDVMSEQWISCAASQIKHLSCQ